MKINKIITNPIFIAAATVLIQIFITSLIDGLFLEKGEVILSNGINKGNLYVVSVIIKNYDEKSAIKDVVLYYPSGVSLVEYYGNINATPIKSGIRVIDLAPSRSESLVLVFDQPFEINRISIDEGSQKILLSTYTMDNRLLQKFLSGIPLYLTSAGFYYLFFYFNAKKKKEREDKLLKFEKQFSQFNNQTAKLKVFYSLRFTDYDRELSFWRDTIRKIAYEFGAGKTDVNELFDLVTQGLKTYTINANRKNLTLDEIDYLVRTLGEKGGSDG